MELTLDSPVQYVSRVGPAMAGKLAKLGINTVFDLITYAPFRYDDFSAVTKIKDIRAGNTVSVKGAVVSVTTFVTKNGKKIQQAVVADETGSQEIIWFNQTYLVKVLRPGTEVYLAGKADWFGRKVVLLSPQYEIMADNSHQSLHTGRLVPVYPETAGVSSKWLRGRIDQLLQDGIWPEEDHLPEEIRTQYRLSTYSEAIRAIHYPKTLAEAAEAKRRLAFDELFCLELAAYNLRREWQSHETALPVALRDGEIQQFTGSLPFALTPDQEHAIGEIFTDLGKTVPMNRLLVGDVGSGKTVVAAAAIFAAYRQGLSAALMAPTQILAEQHYLTLKSIFAPLGIEVVLVTGEKKPKTGSLVGGPPVWVGTHALLSDSVSISSLALVVVDEQQRFGVAQRQKLRSKGVGVSVPHLLTMTATPIPRTVALTIFGSLDITTINTKPKGRLPVRTWVVPKEKRKKGYGWIRKLIEGENAQAFVVCPLIEESGTLAEVKSAKTEYDRLATVVYPDLSLGLVHGKLKPGEKTAVLESFRAGKHQLLVATPVVEVGIDIPNARVIVIEAAERFGLSQLHQLRGRVGRSDKASYCLLFTESEDPRVITRLKALETTDSGPLLAEVDLALRGPGEIFGTKQHGLPKLRYASFMDVGLLHETGTAAKAFSAKYRDFDAFPHLSRRLKTVTIDIQPQD